MTVSVVQSGKQMFVNKERIKAGWGFTRAQKADTLVMYVIKSLNDAHVTFYRDSIGSPKRDFLADLANTPHNMWDDDTVEMTYADFAEFVKRFYGTTLKDGFASREQFISRFDALRFREQIANQRDADHAEVMDLMTHVQDAIWNGSSTFDLVDFILAYGEEKRRQGERHSGPTA